MISCLTSCFCCGSGMPFPSIWPPLCFVALAWDVGTTQLATLLKGSSCVHGPALLVPCLSLFLQLLCAWLQWRPPLASCSAFYFCPLFWRFSRCLLTVAWQKSASARSNTLTGANQHAEVVPYKLMPRYTSILLMSQTLHGFAVRSRFCSIVALLCHCRRQVRFCSIAACAFNKSLHPGGVRTPDCRAREHRPNGN